MKSMCVERRIKRVEALIPFTRMDPGWGFSNAQLLPEELPLDNIKSAWQANLALDPQIYDSFEFTTAEDGRLTVRYDAIPDKIVT